MFATDRWILKSYEKENLIENLTKELATLRSKASISQAELSHLIGISRQTYGAIERGTQKMTWNTYLTLVLFFDYNVDTHGLIRSLGAFPSEIIKRFNGSDSGSTIDIKDFFGSDITCISNRLDKQAFRSIRTIVMLEYARCTGMSGEAVIKSFDGMDFGKNEASENDIRALKALNAIKENKNK